MWENRIISTGTENPMNIIDNSLERNGRKCEDMPTLSALPPLNLTPRLNLHTGLDRRTPAPGTKRVIQKPRNIKRLFHYRSLLWDSDELPTTCMIEAALFKFVQHSFYLFSCSDLFPNRCPGGVCLKAVCKDIIPSYKVLSCFHFSYLYNIYNPRLYKTIYLSTYLKKKYGS